MVHGKKIKSVQDVSGTPFDKAELQSTQRKRPASDSDIELVHLEQQTKKLR